MNDTTCLENLTWNLFLQSEQSMYINDLLWSTVSILCSYYVAISMLYIVLHILAMW